MEFKAVSTVKDIKIYSTKELASMYEVCPRTFNKWIAVHKNKIGKKTGRFYSLIQIQTIFETLGLPKSIVDTD